MRNFFLLLCTFLLTGCASLPFQPSKNIKSTPADAGLQWDDVFIPTADGETLHGWFIPSTHQGSASGYTVLFFHGNAGNIGNRLDTIRILHQLGANTLIIDYRGYGKSTGSPSVNGVTLDARAAWEWLLYNKHCKAEEVLLFGRSLGGAVAANLGSTVTPGGIIFESSFTTLYDVAHHMFPYLPVSWFLPQDFDTLQSLSSKTSLPLLVIHSRDDEIVPYQLGRKVYEVYRGPKQFIDISGSHNSGFLESQDTYLRGLDSFFTTLPSRTL